MYQFLPDQTFIIGGISKEVKIIEKRQINICKVSGTGTRLGFIVSPKSVTKGMIKLQVQWIMQCEVTVREIHPLVAVIRYSMGMQFSWRKTTI
jgi:hypothetical protein